MFRTFILVAILLDLKLRQTFPEREEEEDETSLLEMQSVELHKEVLKEKKLVTYYAELQVGLQTFKVLLDTGSCEFWVPSSECNTPRCLAHERFQMPEAASLLEATGQLRVGEMEIKVHQKLNQYVFLPRSIKGCFACGTVSI